MNPSVFILLSIPLYYDYVIEFHNDLKQLPVWMFLNIRLLKFIT